MANEVLELRHFPSELAGAGNALAWTDTELYRLKGTSYTHMWQISPTRFVGYGSGNYRRMVIYGTYAPLLSESPQTWKSYIIKVTSSTTFKFSDDDGATFTTGLIFGDRVTLNRGLFARFFETSGYTTGDEWRFWVRHTNFFPSAEYVRWAVAPTHGGFLFLNPTNQLRFVNTTTVVDPTEYCYSIDMPSGWFLEIYRGHAMIGRPTWKGVTYKNRVMWSDVHDLLNFEVKKFNEADFYDYVTTDDSLTQIAGVTGIKNLDDKCMVYTANAIHIVSYVGLPQVMQSDLYVSHIGNAYPYSLIGANWVHAFISDHNIWWLEPGKTPRPIGDPIKDFFFSDISANPGLRYRLWGFVDEYRGEAVWVYCSTASAGTFDRAIVYNFREDLWWVREVKDFHSFLRQIVVTGGSVIDDMSNTIDSYTGLIDSYGAPTGHTAQYIYGSAGRVLYREQASGDALADLFAVANPYLETNDLIHGNIENPTEVNSMLLQGEYDTTQCQGIQVEVSNRYNIDDTVSYTNVGLWTKAITASTSLGRNPLPRKSGRVFRYKFTFLPASSGKLKDVKFSGWGGNVRAAGAEK